MLKYNSGHNNLRFDVFSFSKKNIIIFGKTNYLLDKA